jgi:hypothetical protein
MKVENLDHLGIVAGIITSYYYGKTQISICLSAVWFGIWANVWTLSRL